MVNLNEEKLETIDWTDSNKVFAFSVGTVHLAVEYQKARKTFAKSLKTLKIGLATAYKDHSIERRLAEDKAYTVLADKDETYREALMNLIDSEHQYKGLEKVVEARQATVSLAQSLIKNRVENA